MAKEWVPAGITFSDSNDPIWDENSARRHHHKKFEVTVVLDGTGYFECGSILRSVRNGSVCMIPPSLDTDHTFVRTSSTMQFATLHSNSLPTHLQGLLSSRALKEGLQVTEIAKPIFREFVHVLRLCADLENTAQTPLVKDHLRASSLNIILNYVSQRSVSTNSQLLSISDIGTLLRGRIDEDWDVSSLAKMTGMSESHFRRQFKIVFGMSPKCYQQRCRMEEAQHLLLSTTQSIEGIAFLVGFASVSSFSTWFRYAHGQSPSEWRETKRSTAHDDSPEPW